MPKRPMLEPHRRCCHRHPRLWPCPGMARADEIVRIAYIDPLSGSLAATGQLGEQHFRFAIDRANASGAAGPGRKLELVARSTMRSARRSR